MRMARSSKENSKFLTRLCGIDEASVEKAKDLTYTQEREELAKQSDASTPIFSSPAYGLVSNADKVWNPQTNDFNRLALQAGVVLKDKLEDLSGGTGGVMIDLEEVRPLETKVVAARYADHQTANQALMSFTVNMMDRKGRSVKAHCVVAYDRSTGRDAFTVESPIYVGSDPDTAEAVELTTEAVSRILGQKGEDAVEKVHPLAVFNAEEDCMELIPVEKADVVASKLVEAGFAVKASWVDRCYGPQFGRVCNEVQLNAGEMGKLVSAVKDIVSGMGGKADADWFDRAEEKGKADYPKDKSKDWVNRADEKGSTGFKDRDWPERADEKPEAASEAKSAYGSEAKMMRFEQRRAALRDKKAQRLEKKPNIAELKKSLSEKLSKLAADLEAGDQPAE